MAARTSRIAGADLRTLILAGLVVCPMLAVRPAQASPATTEQAAGATQQDDRARQQSERQRDAATETEDGEATGLRLTAEEEAEIGVGGKRMTATPVSRRPVIDGVVDDDVWSEADIVTDFLQRDPDNGEPASERTEVRILYDEDNIYVAFVLYDSDPEGIVARDLRRDSRLNTDDTMAVLFDTYHDHRNGFLFRVNALGTKYDAQVQNEQQLNSQWDERWEAAARITEQGWEAELEIPWKALRFPTGTHIWGVDFKREIRRKNEEANWSNHGRGYDFRNVSQMGHLVGLQNLSLTQRFKLKPYVTGDYADFNATSTPLSEGNGDVGVEDFKIQITPNLTADLTVNTDFAQVEDDNARVNLTRFPLFFPEKREFFLEGANNFTFGSRGEGGGGFGAPLATLYHSRNIGLVGGSPVPMRYGAKITGKIGGATLGIINAHSGAAGDVAANNYSTVRIQQDVFQRSSIGALFTNVQRGDGGGYNRVAGLDGNFRFFEYLGVSGYVAHAQDSEIDGGAWIGEVRGGWNSDLWSANAQLNRIDADFRTDLGFIRRRDIIRQDYSVGWKPRPSWSWLRQVTSFASVEYITDTSGMVQTKNQTIWVRAALESGDGFNFSVTDNFERLEDSFNVSGEGVVPAGDYDYVTWRVSFNTYGARRVSGRVNVNGGGFFNGDRSSMGGSLTFRVNEKLSFSPSYDFNRITLPDAEFDTHTARMRASYNFNERWLTNALVQYNSVSEQLSIFARLNYIYRTGDDLFIVFKQTTEYDDPWMGLSDRAVIMKATRSFDF